jgi:hypothetical protein
MIPIKKTLAQQYSFLYSRFLGVNPLTLLCMFNLLVF